MAEQLTFDLPTRAALDRADFLVSEANALALARLEDWRDWSPPRLVLSGPRSSGKSHLARVWALEAGAEVIAAESLVAAGPAWRGPGGNLALEDCDAMLGDPEFETALFHLINDMAAKSHALLLTGERRVGHWDVGLADLKSRLLASDTARLGEPDDALIAGLLVKHFADRQLRVPPEVISYLLSRLERSAFGIETFVRDLDAHALKSGKRISRSLVARFLDNWQKSRA